MYLQLLYERNRGTSQKIDIAVIPMTLFTPIRTITPIQPIAPFTTPTHFVSRLSDSDGRWPVKLLDRGQFLLRVGISCTSTHVMIIASFVDGFIPCGARCGRIPFHDSWFWTRNGAFGIIDDTKAFEKCFGEVVSCDNE